MSTKTHGQVAYETGAEFLAATQEDGLAAWQDLSANERLYWERIGSAVVAASLPLRGMMRFELIDLMGRRLVMLGAATSLSVQDEGATLKVFVEADVTREWNAQNVVSLENEARRDFEELRKAIRAFISDDHNLGGRAYRDMLNKAGLWESR